MNTTKTVSAVFHLNNKEAKHELKVNFNNETLPFCSEPKYLGVTLDRSLTYRRHLESLRKKLTSRIALLRRLAGSGWVAGAATLRTWPLWQCFSIFLRHGQFSDHYKYLQKTTRMIQTLVLANSVHCPHSQISMRILSLSLFHKFVEIRACGLQRTPDVVLSLKLVSVPGFKNNYIAVLL